MEIFKLFGSIFIDNDEANKSLSKTDEKAESVASKLGNGVKKAAAFGTAVVGATGVAVGGMMALADKTAGYADEMDKLSERTGIGVENLQRWKYAAGQSGADVGKLEVGMKTLSDIMDNAMNGSGKAIESFEALGISVDDLRNKSQEEIFDTVMNSLADMEEGATRNAIGNDLLGKSYTEMLPLLNAGSDGMQELKDRADELGLVMSEDAIAAGVKFGDTIDDVKSSLEAIVMQLANAFLPVLQQFLDFILAHMPEIRELLSNVFDTLAVAVESALPVIMELMEEILPVLIDLFGQIANDILPIIIPMFADFAKTVLPPLVKIFSEITKKVLPVLINLFKVVIDKVLPPLMKLFGVLIETVLPPLMELFDIFVTTVLPPLIDIFSVIIDQILPPIIELFTHFCETVLPPLMELIVVICETILPPLLDLFMELADVVIPLVMAAFEAILPVLEPIMDKIASVISVVLALIKGDWEGVWDGIKSFFSATIEEVKAFAEGFATFFGKIFQGISDTVGDIWDGMVDGIKSAINWIIDKINGFIRGVNKISIDLPGQSKIGFDIDEIPKLAEGGKIFKSGKVMVGEAGPEILDLPVGAKVTPLDKAGGITVNFYDTKVLDDRDTAILSNRIVSHLKRNGVFA